MYSMHTNIGFRVDQEEEEANDEAVEKVEDIPKPQRVKDENQLLKQLNGFLNINCIFNFFYNYNSDHSVLSSWDGFNKKFIEVNRSI